MFRLKQKMRWCRNPPAPVVEVPKREVWAVPDHLVLRKSVEEVQLVRTPHFTPLLAALLIARTLQHSIGRCSSGHRIDRWHQPPAISSVSVCGGSCSTHVAKLRVTPTPNLGSWGLTPQVPGLQACEEAAYEDATPERFLEPWQKDGWRLRGFVRDQLLEAGVQDAGAIWGTEREATHPMYAVCC